VPVSNIMAFRLTKEQIARNIRLAALTDLDTASARRKRARERFNDERKYNPPQQTYARRTYYSPPYHEKLKGPQRQLFEQLNAKLKRTPLPQEWEDWRDTASEEVSQSREFDWEESRSANAVLPEIDDPQDSCYGDCSDEEDLTWWYNPGQKRRRQV